MKRYIAQFHSAGFPELYVVVDTTKDTGGIISEPMAYHQANDQARRMNQEPAPQDEWTISPAFTNWLPGAGFTP